MLQICPKLPGQKFEDPPFEEEILSFIRDLGHTDEGTGVLPGVPDVPTYGSKDEQISWKSSDEDNNDEANLSENDDDQDDDNGEELDEDETNEEEEVNELYRDMNVNLEGRDTKMTDDLLANVQTTQVIEDTHVIITAVTPEVQQQSSSVSSGFISNMLNPNPNTDRVKALEDNFSEFKQTNLFAEVVSLIPGIVDTKSQGQVKVQVKEQVSKILPRIKKLVNEQLEAEVLIRSSNKAKTSHAVAANLSELELKKI
ncbi:hypothetical protein Tco_0628676 [Tanacetum coccineum]|uniref:Uncharacterized protein n=1 Tax=Tanacetum coccineum TaxID=301880 RepID=A0ABQ4WQZ9_9ASTR